MHRLVYICDWLPPDFGAVGQYSLMFARQRAAAGEDVVLAGLSSTGDSLVEETAGAGRLRVLRRRTATYDRANLPARALWTLRTNLGLLWRARRHVLAADELLITGSPPFLLHLAAPLATLLRQRLTYRITDFHPECLMAEIAERTASEPAGSAGQAASTGQAGIRASTRSAERTGSAGRIETAGQAGNPGQTINSGQTINPGQTGSAGRVIPGKVPWGLRAFYRLTLLLRRRVDRFEVLGEDQRRRLLAQGIPEDRIVLKRDPSPVAIPAETEPLAHPAELAGRRLLLYSGNFGVAHDDETFIAGYRLHHRQGSGRVGLWLNATGARADHCERVLRDAGLPVHRGRPVPLELLPRLLVTADAHLITLRNAFVGYVLPSKIYACLESRRGVLYIGSRESDIHLLSAAALPTGYAQVEVGDAAGVARALEAIADRAEVGRDRSPLT